MKQKQEDLSGTWKSIYMIHLPDSTNNDPVLPGTKIKIKDEQKFTVDLTVDSLPGVTSKFPRSEVKDYFERIN